MSNTTWDGNNWSNGFPDSSTSAIIDGLYDTGNYGSIDCCSLSVTAQGNLIINLGDYCNVYSNISVDPAGTLLVKSGGSLIPNSTSAVSVGDVRVERKTPTLKRFDYTYWSSPVSTTVGAALPPSKWEPLMTFTFFTPNYYDVETSYWGTFISNLPDGQDDNQDAWTRSNSTDSMIPGKGYASMVKSLDGTGTFPRTETVAFIGPLNVGNLSIQLDQSQNTSSDLDDFNLVGNPYSSSINSNDLIDMNASSISGTLYFWTHTNTLSTAYTGLAMLNYSPNDYAKYTKLGGITAIFGGKKPSNVIGSCQGFLVEAEGTSSNLLFSPSLMSKAYVNTTPVSFYKTNTRKNNLWLNMKNDLGLFSQQLIGYNQNSDLNYNKGWDSRIMETRLVLKFYSIENGIKYDIQARGEFEDSDMVKLGYFSATDGQFKISVDSGEGSMKNQEVYLYDYSFGIWHNMSTPYTFTTTSGTFDNRFFITYRSPSDNDDEIDRKVIIGEKTKIDVYDISGRFIKTMDGDNFDSLPSQQILILKIHEDDKIVTKKYFRE
jgi:hypothetical protein